MLFFFFFLRRRQELSPACQELLVGAEFSLSGKEHVLCGLRALSDHCPSSPRGADPLCPQYFPVGLRA